MYLIRLRKFWDSKESVVFLENLHPAIIELLNIFRRKSLLNRSVTLDFSFVKQKYSAATGWYHFQFMTDENEGFAGFLIEFLNDSQDLFSPSHV